MLSETDRQLPDLSHWYHMDLCRLMEDQDEYSENYMLRAVTVGQTTLVAIATDRMGKKFTSAPRHIEVGKVPHVLTSQHWPSLVLFLVFLVFLFLYFGTGFLCVALAVL